MKTLLLSLIIVCLIIYLGHIIYQDYIRDRILISHGLSSHLLEDNGQKALKFYNKANSYDIQEKIGNIYFYGTKNTHKDYDKALLYYKRVFLYDPDNRNIKRIREKINHIMKFKLINVIKEKQDDNKLDNNINYHEQILNDDVKGYIDNLNNNSLDDIKKNINLDEIVQNIDNYDINNIQDLEENDLYKRNDDTHIQNDKQNVHDTGINNTIKTSIQKLKEHTFIKYNYNDIFNKLLTDLENSDMNEMDKFRIRNVLREITQKQDFKVGNIELKECLTIVGNRIYSQTDKDTINTILYNLFSELKDCIKDTGEVLCLMGIFNRIIHCLNIVDELVVIKPTWALREELMRKCCNIRKELEKKISCNDINFTDKLKNNIITTLKKEYVHDNNILSLQDFNKEIESWIEYV